MKKEVRSQESGVRSYKNRRQETKVGGRKYPRPLTPHSSLLADKGMALVLTLMVVTIITALVVEFAYGVYTNTSALYNWQTSQKLSLAAQSATRLGSKLINEDLPEFRTSDHFIISQKIPFQDLDGTIILRIEDENAKFNLNTLMPQVIPPADKDKEPYAMFGRLLKELELSPEIADRITDWLDSDNTPKNPGLPDSEKGSKNGKLDSVDELLLIPGIDRETYEKLLPYVTIFGIDTKININRASLPVLRSLSGDITKKMAEDLVEYRKNTPFKETGNPVTMAPGFERDVGSKLGGYIRFDGTAYRIVAAAESNGIRRIVESVLEDSGSTKTVKYWKEM